MASATLLISIILSVTVLVVPPVIGLVLFIAALIGYPNYLKVNMAGVDFTVCRLLIMFVFIRIFMAGYKLKRLSKLDKAVIAVFLCQIVAGVTTSSSISNLLVNRAGAIFDMLLPYFAVRMIISSQPQYVQFLKGCMVALVPFAILSMYQCITGINVYAPFEDLVYWRVRPSGYGRRYGLYRSNLATAHPIIYGLLYAMLLPLFIGLWHKLKQQHMLLGIGIFFAFMGLFSSVSSGPYLAALLSFMFLACYRFRRYWKMAVWGILALLVCVEILSNRHWYHVFCDFTMNPATSWYRGRLMEVALSEGGMSGHWLTGYGQGVDPQWGYLIDGRAHTDMVNHYLLILSQFGLIGFVPFIVMNYLMVKNLILAWKRTATDENRFMIWGLAASFFGLALSAFSVSLIGPPSTLYYMLVGIAAVLPKLMAGTKRTVRVVRKRKKIVSQQQK